MPRKSKTQEKAAAKGPVSDKSEKISEQPVQPSKKQRPTVMALLILVVLVVVVGVVMVFARNDSQGKDTRIGSSELSNIRTYLSKSSDDENREAQLKFTVGDPIQIGFSYTSESEDDLVRFRVINRDTEETAFETNLFRLAPTETELYVSINNTSLPAGTYRVALVTMDDNESESIEYEITE